MVVRGRGRVRNMAPALVRRRVTRVREARHRFRTTSIKRRPDSVPREMITLVPRIRRTECRIVATMHREPAEGPKCPPEGIILSVHNMPVAQLCLEMLGMVTKHARQR